MFASLIIIVLFLTYPKLLKLPGDILFTLGVGQFIESLHL